jgi:site-specific DNA-methyltransferase (adenine-specific)
MREEYNKQSESINLLEEPSLKYASRHELFNSGLELENFMENNKSNNIFEPITKNSLIGKGDCEELMGSIENNSIDLILTDPPFNLGSFMRKRGTNLVKMRENQFSYAGWDDLEYDEWYLKMDAFFKHSNRVLRKKGSLVLFMSLMKIETIIQLAEKNNFYYKTVGIWHKTNPMPRNMNLQFINSTEAWIYFINEGTTGTFNNDSKALHDFVETSLTTQNEKRFGKHPTQKPIKILNHFTEILSNENDVICDPFMGSGSTGVSCEILNRKFIGIELNEDYYNIAKKRMQNITTK